MQRTRQPTDAVLAEQPLADEMRRSPGRPLDAVTRAYFEPRFGHDFSRIRVHDNSHAASSAHALHALAYTVGSHIVFGAGQFAPGMERGRHLLAHELTHTLQQNFAEVATADPPVVGALPGPFVQRAPDAVDVDLTVVPDEEAKGLKEKNVNLPVADSGKWLVPRGKELEADRDRIIAKLDVGWYSDADEQGIVTLTLVSTCVREGCPTWLRFPLQLGAH